MRTHISLEAMLLQAFSLIAAIVITGCQIDIDAYIEFDERTLKSGDRLVYLETRYGPAGETLDTAHYTITVAETGLSFMGKQKVIHLREGFDSSVMEDHHVAFDSTAPPRTPNPVIGIYLFEVEIGNWVLLPIHSGPYREEFTDSLLPSTFLPRPGSQSSVGHNGGFEEATIDGKRSDRLIEILKTWRHVRGDDGKIHTLEIVDTWHYASEIGWMSRIEHLEQGEDGDGVKIFRHYVRQLREKSLVD